jgi:glycosyltransferase involved in cell wall biosynthesis
MHYHAIPSHLITVTQGTQVMEAQVARPQLSVVIPLYNEEDNVEPLYEELTEALEEIGRTYEVVAVDDGSSDLTFAKLKKVHEHDSRWRIVRFRRNFGQTAGMSAGFDAARGEIIVTIDADLQNDPRDIPKLLAKLDEGYDIVNGWRQNRKENYIIRKLPSKLANGLISRVTGVHLHDYGCTLKVYRSEVAKHIDLYGELHRFIPAVASWMGVTVTEVPVSDRARRFGKSKYGIWRTFRVILDLLTVTFLLKYATKPLHFFGFIGMGIGGLGAVIGLYLSYERIFLGEGLSDRPLLLLAVLLVIIGFQMLSLGLVAEIVMRNYYNSEGKMKYVVREQLDDTGEGLRPDADPREQSGIVI